MADPIVSAGSVNELADKAFLESHLAQAHRAPVGTQVTVTFRDSSTARKARRRLYYIAQQLNGLSRQRMNVTELKLVGRTIAFVPRTMLSSLVIEANHVRP